MKKGSGSENHVHVLIIAILLLSLALVYLFVNFRGLKDPVAMDQAQIARQVARGEGMTTKYLRPIALTTTHAAAVDKAKSEENKLKKQAREQDPDSADISVPVELNVTALPETSNAPLNILANAVALAVTGGTDYDAWKMNDRNFIYGPDRIIAGVSLLFFILSVGMIYYLTRRIFDTTIASITSILVILSDLFLQFSVSGLPQMMMLFFFMLGVNSLYSAIERKIQGQPVIVPILLCSLFFSLVCLAGWIGIWAYAGLLIFIGIYFRPHGLYCIPPIVILILCAVWSVYHNYHYTGNPFGIAVYAVYQGIAGDSETIMRSVTQADVMVRVQTILTLVIGNSLKQVTLLFSNMGGIIVTPFFFLALFHPFRNTAAGGLKWAILSIWVCSAIGMTLYSPEEALSGGQLQILSAPLFTAYGLSMLFVMIGRVQALHPDVKGIRPFVVTLIVLVSSGGLIMSIPQTLKIGLATESTGLAQWPPYFPYNLNASLHDRTEPGKVIASDQPWAVAWYADRPSMWLPRKRDGLELTENILRDHGSSIGGILITPASTEESGGLLSIMSKYGDYRQFILDGTLLAGYPEYTAFLTNAYSQGMQQDPLSKRFMHAESRLMFPHTGAWMIYYSETPMEKQ